MLTKTCAKTASLFQHLAVNAPSTHVVSFLSLRFADWLGFQHFFRPIRKEIFRWHLS